MFRFVHVSSCPFSSHRLTQLCEMRYWRGWVPCTWLLTCFHLVLCCPAQGIVKNCACASTLPEQWWSPLINFKLKHIRCSGNAITIWWAELSFGPMCCILQWFTAFCYHMSTLCKTWEAYSRDPQKMDNRGKRTGLSCCPRDVLTSKFSPCVHVCCSAAQRPLLGCSWGSTSAALGTPRAGRGGVTAMTRLAPAAKWASDKAARCPSGTSSRLRWCSLHITCCRLGTPAHAAGTPVFSISMGFGPLGIEKMQNQNPITLQNLLSTWSRQKEGGNITLHSEGIRPLTQSLSFGQCLVSHTL